MATFKDGVNGPFKGKVGSVIGSSWRKINYMKGFGRYNKNRPASPKQVLQRRKFALLNQFFDRQAYLLEIGFGAFTGRATGRNMAFSYNYDQAFLVNEDDVRLNYAALSFSHGSLLTAGDERAWLVEDTLHVSWDPSTYGMSGAADDVARLIVYDEKNDIFRGVRRAVRADGGIATDLSKVKADTSRLHIWFFFIDELRKQVSKTTYIPITDQP